MNKQIKRFIALGLTISLVSVPMLSEVLKANEVSKIQQEGISLLSMEIDEAMQSVKVDQFSMDDFALTILEQPDIVDLEVMEDLPKHQQTMREHAEEYLKDIKPELIELNERSILVAEYMSLYNDYFVSEIENVQKKKSSEQEVKQNIEAGLQDLNFIIEEENAKITDTQKEIEGFLVNLEEDYETFEAGVAEAEEYVIEREGEIAEETIEKMDEMNEKANDDAGDLIATIGTVVAIGVIAAVFGYGVRKLPRMWETKPFKIKWIAQSNGTGQTKKVFGPRPVLGNKAGTIVGLTLGLGGAWFWLDYRLEITNLFEESTALEQELLTAKLIENEANGLIETTNNTMNSFNDLTNEWRILQSNVQIMMGYIDDENINELKPQFEEASTAWKNTQTVSELFQQIKENELDPVEGPVEIDLDGVDTEEEFEEALKEAHGVDKLIDISELTDEELEELLLDLVEDELDEAA